MHSKRLNRINESGMSCLLVKFAEMQLKEDITCEEMDGIVKFLKYLMKEWEVEHERSK